MLPLGSTVMALTVLGGCRLRSRSASFVSAAAITPGGGRLSSGARSAALAVDETPDTSTSWVTAVSP